MSWTRAALVVGSVALASAALLALASRAPASLRAEQRPGRGATDPTRGARFTDEQVRRGAAYSGPGYLGFALTTLVQVVLLVVLLRGPFARVTGALEHMPGGLLARAALLAVALVALSSLAALPLAFVRGYVIEHAWGLSTQDVGGWLTDRLRALGVGAVVSGVAAVAFFAIARWQPRTWWLWGWATFTLLTAGLVFLWPVVIAPLFNRFTPLADASLRADIRALAERAGVDVDEVLVADASRRTTAENAYVAGLGGTKRIVLYDTLLEAGGERETLYVVGHELGHEVEGHVVKGVALSSVGLLAGFAALAWLARSERVLAWVGAGSIGDVRVIPALLLFTTIAGLLTLPVESAVSRSFERRADEIAVALTRDRDTAVRALRRLGLSNLADLAPPAVAVALFYSHPPIPERIRNVLAPGSGP